MSDDGKPANFDHILRERVERDEAERVRESMLSVVQMKRDLAIQHGAITVVDSRELVKIIQRKRATPTNTQPRGRR